MFSRNLGVVPKAHTTVFIQVFGPCCDGSATNQISYNLGQSIAGAMRVDDLELITVEEMDALPDDPQEAFVMFEGICRRRMNTYINNIGQNDATDADEIRVEYMTRIAAAAAAAAYGVVDIEESYVSDFSIHDFKTLYRKAVAVATRLNIEKRQRQRGMVVHLPEGTKARLKVHLDELRKAVNASDLDSERKKILTAKLDAFEKELEREKSNITVILTAASLVAAGINQALGGVGKLQHIVTDMPKTIEAISLLIGKESLAEQEQASLPAPPPVKALPPPQGHRGRATAGAYSDDDDDVPF